MNAKPEKTPQDRLDDAAALVVTSLSQRNLKAHNSTYTVTVPRHRIEALHQALEELYPGWVERIYQGMKDQKKAGRTNG